ncbi:hypothetical protein GOP47_0021666 [Adiantum capillus-veneris]|uniref:TATA-box-binding protein n=1 Tax=Adiantum capillus-veneris TaxID=13818 RepID=A0A9D4U9P0_ADICA|nr:hypothetical protein GOP47_0021666 [Adiantum capillus-veneris]
MGAPPLNVKKAKSSFPEEPDEDELPIQCEGPTIPGPLSVNIPQPRQHRPSKQWYVRGPPAPTQPLNSSLPRGVSPVIQNLVCTIQVGCPLNVAEVALKARNAEYNPRSFRACIMRLKEPKATALIFGTGKVVITGTKELKHCEEASRKFVRILNKIGYPTAKLQNHTIQNVVATCDMKFGIALPLLDNAPGVMVEYDSGVFPGAIMRTTNPKTCFLVFSSGKVVLTGLKDINLVQAGFEKAYEIVSGYKKEPMSDAAWNYIWVLK